MSEPDLGPQEIHPAEPAFAATDIFYLLHRSLKDKQAAKDNPAIASGVNTYAGKVTCKNLADSFDDVEYVDIDWLA